MVRVFKKVVHGSEVCEHDLVSHTRIDFSLSQKWDLERCVALVQTRIAGVSCKLVLGEYAYEAFQFNTKARWESFLELFACCSVHSNSTKLSLARGKPHGGFTQCAL